MTEKQHSSRNELREGKPCPACYQTVRYPLSHSCDARQITASISNDVKDFIVSFGGEEHRIPRAVFLHLVRKRDSLLSETEPTDEIVARMIATRDEEIRLLRSALDEVPILTKVLNQARETLLISIKGTPEELQRSLGKLNLACKAHWDWQTERMPK